MAATVQTLFDLPRELCFLVLDHLHSDAFGPLARTCTAARAVLRGWQRDTQRGLRRCINGWRCVEKGGTPIRRLIETSACSHCFGWLQRRYFTPLSQRVGEIIARTPEVVSWAQLAIDNAEPQSKPPAKKQRSRNS